MDRRRSHRQRAFALGTFILWSTASGCAGKSAPGHSPTIATLTQGATSQAAASVPTEAATDKASAADVMTLGKPVTQGTFNGSGVLQVLQPLAGREAHNLWTDPTNTSKPSFLMLNDLDATGAVTTRAFPLIKPVVKDNHKRAPHEITLADKLNARSIFDPQFSPDGHYILFKFGDIASPGIYRIYVFDTQTGKTRLACPFYLSYYALSWSPDGNYIAFAKGGEPDPRVYDYGRFYQGKLQLSVCNWRTGETYPVISSDTLRGPWAWKAPHTLLYGALSPQDEAFLNDPRYKKGTDFVNGQPISWERLQGGAKRKPVTPSVYQYSIETRRSQLLCRDAYLPVASPDGEYLAFFGSADTASPFALNKDWKDAPVGVFVVVTKADGTNPNASDAKSTKRTVLSQHYGSYPDLFWPPDNQHLLVLQQVAKSPDARLEIKEWDIHTAKSRLVATLTAHDPGNDLRSDNNSMFQPLNLSEDGTHLMIQVDEYYSLGESKGYLNQDTLQDVDLQTGNVTAVGRIRAIKGLDWHYGRASTADRKN